MRSTTTDNPFRTAPGSDPPALLGRDEEISAVQYSLALSRDGAPAQPIVFTGLRGMGKTALLRRCVNEARNADAIVIHAEASDSEPLAETLKRGLERAKKDVASLPQRLKASMDAVIKAIPRASLALPGEMGSVELAANDKDNLATPFIDVLEELNAAVRKHDRFLVFAIDELQEAPAPDLRSLVRFIHETAGTETPAFFLGAGLPNSPEHLHRVRTYTERWRFFRIGLLTREQTMDAVAIPVKQRGLRIEASALDSDCRRVGGLSVFHSGIWLRGMAAPHGKDDHGRRRRCRYPRSPPAPRGYVLRCAVPELNAPRDRVCTRACRPRTGPAPDGRDSAPPGRRFRNAELDPKPADQKRCRVCTIERHAGVPDPAHGTIRRATPAHARTPGRRRARPRTPATQLGRSSFAARR